MEYMLLKDGSVRVYEVMLKTAWDVWDEMQAHDGIAYYWRAHSQLSHWYRIDTYTHSVFMENEECLVFRELDLPEVIKLAVMLG